MILRRQHDGGNSDELHDLFCQNSFCVGVGFSRAFGRNEKNPRSFVYNFRSTELLVKTNFASALDFSGCLITMHVKCSNCISRRRWIFCGCLWTKSLFGVGVTFCPAVWSKCILRRHWIFSRAFGRNEKKLRSFVYNFRSTELLVKQILRRRWIFPGIWSACI